LRHLESVGKQASAPWKLRLKHSIGMKPVHHLWDQAGNRGNDLYAFRAGEKGAHDYGVLATVRPHVWTQHGKWIIAGSASDSCNLSFGYCCLFVLHSLAFSAVIPL
jgi:hypothetical protein